MSKSKRIKLEDKNEELSAERLEDVAQNEIIKAFPSITDFKKFARSKNGLSLDEHEIRRIEEDNLGSTEEQKLRMIFKWEEKHGPDATCAELRYLVVRYRTGDPPKNYIRLSKEFGMYTDKLLCKQSRVYSGDQKSEVTGFVRSRAIKILLYDEENLKEAIILENLIQHEHLISIKHVGVYTESALSKYIYIVMELCDPRTLVDYFEECKKNDNAFDELERWNMSLQLIAGLMFLHKNQIVHRDLKPHNILFSSYTRKILKLVDFGLSKVITKSSLTLLTRANVGTNGYRAPETYNNDVISKKTDVYSAGITIAEIHSNGKHPFGDDPDLWNYRIKTNKNLDLDYLLVSNKTDAKNLITPMLEFEADKRPSADQNLYHEWLIHKMKVEKTLANSDPVPSKALKTHQNEANSIVAFHVYDTHLYMYKPSTGKWSQMPHTHELKGFSTIVLNEHIYMLKEHRVHRLNYRDPKSRWVRKTDMIHDHGNSPPVGVFNGEIYICGRGDLIPSKSVEKYNVDFDQWTKIQDMNVARRRQGVVAADGHIYCIGGSGFEDPKMSSVERFDEKTEKWKNINDILRPTFKPSVVLLNRIIYVADDIGVQCFDLNTSLWKTLKLEWPFRIEYTIKILVVDGKLYLTGYIQNLQQLIYLLEPDIEQMTIVEEMKDSRTFIHACVSVNL